MKFVLFTLTMLVISACASKPVIIERIPFNPAEFARLPSNGSATISGQAYLKSADGKIYYPQNQQARLNPKTSYSQQWYEVNYLDRMNIAKADPRYLEYVYKADMNEQGQFSFKNIPAGDYYISAPIFWMEEIKMNDGSILLKRRGAFICYEIKVEEGQTIVTDITTAQPVNIASSK